MPEPDEVENVVDEFLADRPRARKLAELRNALQDRLDGLKAALARETEEAERARLQKEIQNTERQIEALAREELITEFVEDSVRATASWSLLRPEDTEE